YWKRRFSHFSFSQISAIKCHHKQWNVPTCKSSLTTHKLACFKSFSEIPKKLISQSLFFLSHTHTHTHTYHTHTHTVNEAELDAQVTFTPHSSLFFLLCFFLFTFDCVNNT